MPLVRLPVPYLSNRAGRPHLEAMRASKWAMGAGLTGLAMVSAALLTTLGVKRRARRQIRQGMSDEAGLPLIDSGPGALPGLLWQATGARFHEGNRVEWRFNGHVFDQVLEDLEAARDSVRIAIYIWQPGDPGDRLAEAVKACARRGCKVQIIVDPLGSEGFEEHLQAGLLEAGCEVQVFRSPGMVSALRLAGRHHRKMILIDDAIAFTGGFGIASQWTGDGHSEGCWRDTHVRIEGPVVRSMLQTFASSWLEAAGALLPLRAPPARSEPATSGGRAAFVASREVAGWTHSFLLSWLAVGTARRQLWIANAYFYPPAELLELLCRKAREGVDVRLLLPGKHIDHLFARIAQRTCYPPLLEAGVRIFEYRPTMMHAKTVLVDERLSVVGSINMDPLSLYWLEEGSLVVDDPEVARGLSEQWAKDLALCDEVAAERAEGLGRLWGWGSRQIPARRLPRPA